MEQGGTSYGIDSARDSGTASNRRTPNMAAQP
jgi:hypothetical protein